jgi:DnaJ family protein C protein 11
MARPVAQKVAVEREKGGLIIISAQYGLASAFTDRGVRVSRTSAKRSEGEADGRIEDEVEEEVVVDVTVPVQGLVVDSRLHIPGGRGKVSSAGDSAGRKVELIIIA